MHQFGKKKYASIKKEKFIYWNYRKKLIIDIISKYEPDICLLCEVEYSNIIFFSKFCIKNNYGYIYTWFYFYIFNCSI